MLLSVKYKKEGVILSSTSGKHHNKIHDEPFLMGQGGRRAFYVLLIYFSIIALFQTKIAANVLGAFEHFFM